MKEFASMASDTKFTPGPWSADDVDDGSGEINVISCSRPYVCIVLPGAIHGLTEANAHLIAAAPDLYAVVEELEESSYYWSEYCVPLGIVDRLRAALAKARGEA